MTIIMYSVTQVRRGGASVQEREAIVSDAQSLIAQIEQAIGYQPSR